MGRRRAGPADGVGAVTEAGRELPPIEIRATYVDAGPRLMLRWGDPHGGRHELVLGKGDREALPPNTVLVFD